MDKNLYSDLEKSSYTEDKEYSESNKRKLYVINFTPLRLIAFVVSFFVVFIALFTLGFSLGTGNNSKARYLAGESNSLLMREDKNTLNSAPEADGELLNSINNKQTESITDMKTLKEISPNRGIILNDSNSVEGNTSVVANYENYTATLNRELESMNKNIKNEFDIRDVPSVGGSKKTDDMYIQVPVPDSLPPVKTSSISKVTKTPYTSNVEDGSLYYIQVAVGYNKNFVEKESERLKKISSKVFIKEEKKDNAAMYKLKIGRFTSKAEAYKVLGEVRKIAAYKDSYIYTDNK